MKVGGEDGPSAFVWGVLWHACALRGQSMGKKWGRGRRQTGRQGVLMAGALAQGAGGCGDEQR